MRLNLAGVGPDLREARRLRRREQHAHAQQRRGAKKSEHCCGNAREVERDEATRTTPVEQNVLDPHMAACAGESTSAPSFTTSQRQPLGRSCRGPARRAGGSRSRSPRAAAHSPDRRRACLATPSKGFQARSKSFQGLPRPSKTFQTRSKARPSKTSHRLTMAFRDLPRAS